MFDIDEEREKLDEEYREKVANGEYHEYEAVIVIKGRSAFDLKCCGEEDVRYFLDEGRLLAQAKDIKSVKFYDKTEEKQRYALAVQKRIIGKGAFDDMK